MNPDVGDIKQLMLHAFDQAFIAQIGQLFKVYNQNAPTVEEQREYTKKGIENVIASYRLAISVANDWNG